jgi:hypothetical protein
MSKKGQQSKNCKYGYNLYLRDDFNFPVKIETKPGIPFLTEQEWNVKLEELANQSKKK